MNKSIMTSLLCAGLLGACASNNPDQRYDFKSEAPKLKSTLEVPPDLSAPQQQDRYPLPQVSTTAASSAAPQVTTSKPTTNSRPQSQVERAGSQRWLSVQGKTPAELWPLLKAFWQDNGFTILNEEPDVGYMETDWAENRAKLGKDPLRNLLETVGLGSVYSTPERDRFRIRLEKTVSGTDVFFSHRGMYEIYVSEGKDQTRWQPRPTDPEIEAVFLSRFLVRLGVDEATAAQSVRQAAAVSSKAQARISDGSIVLDDSFDRAWRRVGLVLEHNGLAITDRDRTLGTYYVKAASDENAPAKTADSGLLAKLAFWKDGKNSDSATPAALRVKLNNLDGKQVRIELQDKDGKPLPATQASALLQQLLVELR